MPLLLKDNMMLSYQPNPLLFVLIMLTFIGGYHRQKLHYKLLQILRRCKSDLYIMLLKPIKIQQEVTTVTLKLMVILQKSLPLNFWLMLTINLRLGVNYFQVATQLYQWPKSYSDLLIMVGK